MAKARVFRVIRVEDPTVEPFLGGLMRKPLWLIPAFCTEESCRQGLVFLRAAEPSIIRAAEKLGISREMAAAIGDGYATIEPFDEAIALLKG